MITVGIITVSDKGSKGERVDLSGPTIEETIKHIGGVVYKYVIVPDEMDEIKEAIVAMCDIDKLDLVLTTGGTGFAARDITPEATLDVVDKLVPGIPEVMRAKSMLITPKAMLSRAQAGIRMHSLIINLPGSPKAVKESLEAIMPGLEHGIDILTGDASECGRAD